MCARILLTWCFKKRQLHTVRPYLKKSTHQVFVFFLNAQYGSLILKNLKKA